MRPSSALFLAVLTVYTWIYLVSGVRDPGGADGYFVLTPLFVVFAARALQAAFERVPRCARRLAAVVTGVLTLALGLPVLGAVMGTTTGGTPLEAAPLTTQDAGRGYRAVAAFGEVAILPAKLFYALRFQMPLRSFGFATTDLFYRRSYRDLSWEPHTLAFSADALREASRGTERRTTGLALVAPEAAVVFTAGWPFADVARLDVSAVTGGPLSLSLATTFRRCQLGERRLEKGSNVVTFTIPAGCFDSGLLELGFRSSLPAGAVIERLTLDDSRALLPPF